MSPPDRPVAKHACPVHGPLDVPKPVGLHQVAPLFVHDQAPDHLPRGKKTFDHVMLTPYYNRCNHDKLENKLLRL